MPEAQAFDFPMHKDQRAAPEHRPAARRQAHAHVPARTVSRWSEMPEPTNARAMRPHIFGEEPLP